MLGFLEPKCDGEAVHEYCVTLEEEMGSQDIYEHLLLLPLL